MHSIIAYPSNHGTYSEESLHFHKCRNFLCFGKIQHFGKYRHAAGKLEVIAWRFQSIQEYALHYHDHKRHDVVLKFLLLNSADTICSLLEHH
jgi:hypothetical protein